MSVTNKQDELDLDLEGESNDQPNEKWMIMAETFEDVWNYRLEDWIVKQAKNAWKQSKISLLLVPNRSLLYEIKRRLISNGLGMVGVCIWSPQECKKYLWGKLGLSDDVLDAESLGFMLGLESELEDSNLAYSLSEDPSLLVKARNEVEGAGHSFVDHVGLELSRILNQVKTRYQSLELKSPMEVENEILKKIRDRKMPQIFQSVCVVGFGSESWKWRGLLLAAYVGSATFAMAVYAPRWKGEESDQIWINSWEHITHSSFEVAYSRNSQIDKPFERLALAIESGGNAEKPDLPEGSVSFALAENVYEEARIAFRQVVAFLAEGAERVGVLVPGPGVLSREVARRLEQSGIAHYDALGHFRPGPYEADSFKLWLDFQEHQTISSFLLFINSYPKALAGCPFSMTEVGYALKQSFHETLSEHYLVALSWLERLGSPKAKQVGAWLKKIGLLESFARAVDFHVQLKELFELLGWTVLLGAIEKRVGIINRIDQKVSRSLYVKWLREIANSMMRVRGDHGNEFLGRVEVLPYNRAEGVSWTHLVLSGLSEDGWPRLESPEGFLGDALIKKLNRTALRQNEELSFVDLRKHGLLLRSEEKLWLEQKQVLNVLESVTSKLAITSSEQGLEPSGNAVARGDFYNLIYHVLHGADLKKQKSVINLANESRPFPCNGKRQYEDIRKAYLARRTKGVFGEYEFALISRPMPLVIWNASDWELLNSSSAELWLKKYLRVIPKDSWFSEKVMQKALGVWVHKWLGQALLEVFQNGKGLDDTHRVGLLHEALDERMKKTRGTLWEVYQSVDKHVPEWVDSVVRRGRSIAGDIGLKLNDFGDGWKVEVEKKLVEGSKLQFGSGEMDVSGRLDLLLTHQASREWWVIDFKTGDPDLLSAASLKKGKGLQVAIYVKALKESLGENGFGNLLSARSALKEKLLRANEDAEWNSVLEGLNKIQSHGVIGWSGSLFNQYSFSGVYPLATLPVDGKLLIEKWMKTHKGLEAFFHAH
ncbi:MAG: PD-(D/E)XK nuclease family protein [Verrucomicrobiota bacterium]